MPDYVFHVGVVDEILLPKLTHEIENWNPQVDDPDSVPLDIWFVEWTGIIEAEKLAPLYSLVRFQLQRLYDIIDPVAEAEINDAVICWKRILPGPEFTTLIQKTIVPKLASAFKDLLIIDPSDQSMGK